MSSCEKNHKETKSNAVISIWDLGRKLFITKLKKKKKKKKKNPDQDEMEGGALVKVSGVQDFSSCVLREAMNDKSKFKK